MNNLKKIGLTALAASLVATSAFAGEMAVTGSASMEVQHVDSGSNSGRAFSMGNQLDFKGSGELDNGLNITLKFALDQGDNAGSTTAADDNAGAPFDSHSLSVGNDTLGTLVFAGEGGSSAQSAIDDVVTGDLWDSSFGITSANKPRNAAAGDNIMTYTLPTLMDDVKLTASYVPKGNSTGAVGGDDASSTSYAIKYTGIEGLALGYGRGDNNTTEAAYTDVSTMYATYAIGSLTLGYTATASDSESATTTADQDYMAYEIGYTVNDQISVTYGVNEIATPNDNSDQDIEVSGIVASYTAGGMTLKARMIDADNTAHGTAAAEDKSMWELSASFAF